MNKLFPVEGKLYLVFNKGRSLFSRLIEMWTDGPYSHVEIRFPDGTCFSSSAQDKGTRFKRIGFSHPKEWESVIVPDADIEKVRQRCDEINGRKYDHKGIWMWFVLPAKRQNRNEWWCSEACGYALGWKPYRISPNAMYKVALAKAQAFIGVKTR